MTETVLDEMWIRRFSPGPDRGATLVCFPHAGGSASYFRPMSNALKSSLQVFAVQYPGRQDRLHHRCLTTIDEFADEAFTALEPLMNRPLSFFGHSMGAVIAFEVANRMKERLGAAPSTLFVSGRRAPSTHREVGIHLLDDAGLVEELKRGSGTDARILEDKDVLRMILPPLRSDYTAVETYQWRPGPKLDCPVVALVGDEDENVSLDEARAWEEHTTGPFSLNTFSGGHFYLADHQSAVADVVTRQLLSRTA
ncbi:alpha/beta fold hydrolase [Streptomyces sp. NPDC005407]|uniref:thioesterase II family protein n=1 Tax=Streptomyces sp. NPDC005407 TaxID=3155340 RepID=UPI0033BD66B8